MALKAASQGGISVKYEDDGLIELLCVLVCKHTCVHVLVQERVKSRGWH